MTEMVPLTTVPLPVKLRVEDYLLLEGSGAFESYGKTELLDGEVVYMNAQHRPHARIKSRLFRAIGDALLRADLKLEALVEGSVEMPPHNVPEPDISLTAEPEGDGLIPLSSLALVVEVSDSTLSNDLGRKLRIYANAGVAEYWVVDVAKALIHQMWAPEGDGYREHRAVPFGVTVHATTVAGLDVPTDQLA